MNFDLSNVKFLPVENMEKILCFNLVILFFIGVHSGWFLKHL